MVTDGRASGIVGMLGPGFPVYVPAALWECCQCATQSGPRLPRTSDQLQNWRATDPSTSGYLFKKLNLLAGTPCTYFLTLPVHSSWPYCEPSQCGRTWYVRGSFVERAFCRRPWISMPTYSLCRVSTCLRSGTLGGALLVSRQSIPSTAVSGSLDQSVAAGGIPGVDGQCCRLQIVAMSLVCWKSRPM